MPRSATQADAEAIARLAARTFPAACPPHTPAHAIEAHIRTELSPSRFREHMTYARFFVVDDGPELSGYLMLAFDPAPIPTNWVNPIELRRIYVDQPGSGTAGELMATALEQAVGHDVIWLGTNQLNTRAIRFYAKHGFRIVGNRTFVVGGVDEADFVMARTVEA
jgi:GNAT superfamily N-acetyltransferase